MYRSRFIPFIVVILQALAGTKEEWAELFYNTNEIPTSNVVFNISYGDF